MLGKILLTTAFLLAFGIAAFAQTDTNFQKDYEDWKKAKNNQPLNGNLFLRAKAKRMDEQTAVIHFGIGKTTNDFQISVKFVKTEKDANGKMIVTDVPDSSVSVVDGNSDKTEFAQRSYIKKKAAPDANAFEISITVAGKEFSKLILEISDQYAYATFVSID